MGAAAQRMDRIQMVVVVSAMTAAVPTPVAVMAAAMAVVPAAMAVMAAAMPTTVITMSAVVTMPMAAAMAVVAMPMAAMAMTAEHRGHQVAGVERQGMGAIEVNQQRDQGQRPEIQQMQQPQN